MEQNEKTDRHLWNKNNVDRCFSIFSLSFLNVVYGTEWNGTEKLIYIFGIKTMFPGDTQSLA
jgi:hypothetical protein